MTTTFEKAVAFVLGVEKEHSYDDAGGDTWWGIARNYHPDEEPWPPSRERAIEIYREKYWDLVRCTDLPAPIAFVMFDMAVNPGPGRAIRILQSALGVAMDGIIGPKTLSAAANSDAAFLAGDLLARRAMYYANLSTFPVYGFGWFRRCFACQREALSL